MWVKAAAAAVVFGALLAIPGAYATESNPEVEDNVGDATGSGTGFGGAAVDIDAAWVDSEDLAVFNVVIKLASTVAPQQGESFTFTVHALANGTDKLGTVTVTPGPTTQAGGAATGAFLAGARLQVALSRPALGSPPPGTNLTGLFVNSSFRSAVPTVVASDRAPDSGVGRDYVVGTLAPADQDYDGDTLGDRAEMAAGTDPARRDTDADGLADNEEAGHGTNATRADTDADGSPDGDEVDRGTDPTLADSDGDGASDGAEAAAGSDPLKGDTDGDGLGDGDELANGTSATAADSDGDGYRDGQERVAGTDPRDAASRPKGKPQGNATQGNGTTGAGQDTPGIGVALAPGLLAAAWICQERLSRRRLR